MMLKTLLVLLVAIGACAADDCPEKYRRFSDSHTFCQPSNRCNQVVDRGVQQADIETIVRVHNQHRSNVAMGNDDKSDLPSAANMLEMVWDEELASIAQKHAESCNFSHDCGDCRRVPNFSVGQNLYRSSVSGTTVLPKVDWTRAVTKWYNEVQYFHKNQIDPFIFSSGGPATGHFSQVVWATTWRVGCGRATYKLGDKNFKQQYVCNYGPGGNIISGSMYQKGTPCSKCPQNSCSGKDCSIYAGLCKMLKDEAPQFPLPKEVTFSCNFNGEKDCEYTVTEGAKKWEVQKMLSGNSLVVVLGGGESSKVTFDRELLDNVKMCFTMRYSEGPAIQGETCNHQAALVLHVGTYEVEHKMSKCAVRDMKFKMPVNWKSKVKMHFTLSVPQGAPRQFFQLSNIQTKEGSC